MTKDQNHRIATLLYCAAQSGKVSGLCYIDFQFFWEKFLGEPMMKRAVVFTGLVRDEALFLAFLDHFLTQPESAKIPFYFSTWVGELDKYPELTERLQAMNAIVLEQNQPDLILTGHVLHQLVAWDLPFGLIDDDTFVYKSRPDFADLKSFRRFLDYQPVKVASKLFGHILPEYRFLIKGMFAAQPFYLNDITFAGKISDLRRLTSLSLVNMVRYFRMAPEQMIWAPQFIQANSALDAFFRSNIGLIYNDNELTYKNIATLQTDPAYLHALAYYFLMLENGFDFLAKNTPTALERIGEFTTEQLLWGAVELPSIGHSVRCITNRHLIKDYIQAIMHGRVAPSHFGDALRTALDTVKTNKGQFAPGFFQESSARYAAFSAEKLNVQGAKLLHQNGNRSVLTGASADWHQANLGTAVTEKLEAEINFLRRTINQLEARNSGKPT